MPKLQVVAARALLELSARSSSSALRSWPSAPTGDHRRRRHRRQGAAVPGATVTVTQRGDRRRDGADDQQRRGVHHQPARPRPLLGQGQPQRVQDGGEPGILLTGGDVVRHDVKLTSGDARGDGRGHGADRAHSTRPDVSHKVDEKYYHDLPVVTAADVRLAESVLLMQPGYLPMTPNGDPMFRGSQFDSRINGGQTRPPRTSSTAARSATPPGTSRARRARLRSKHPGGHGHHHDLFGPVRPHERRLHRVHVQVGHQHVPRQRLRILRQGLPQRPGLLRRPEDAAQQQELRRHGRRPVIIPLYEGEQDVLLRQLRLDQVPLRARCPASATRRPSTRSRAATSARS